MRKLRKTPAELTTFLAAYDADVGRLFLAARRAVLDAAPDANELIYDAYNAVSAAYTFSERLKEAFCHVAAYPRYVNLGFNRGVDLPDPERLLCGSGTSIRHVRIGAVRDLETAGVQALLAAAVAQGRRSSPGACLGQSIVKPVYPKKRRPGAAKN